MKMRMPGNKAISGQVVDIPPLAGQVVEMYLQGKDDSLSMLSVYFVI